MMMMMMMGGSEVGNVTSFYGVYKSSAQMTFCLCITKMWPKLSTYIKRKYMYENKVKMIVVDKQTDPQACFFIKRDTTKGWGFWHMLMLKGISYHSTA